MFKIHFLNTIWSDCILLQKDDHYALIDTGSSYYYSDIKKYLKANKITKLDFILLTHFHSDHYENIESLINDFTVSFVFYRDYSGKDNYTIDGLTIEQYNNQELNISTKIKESIEKNSHLVIIDDRSKTINFNGQELYIVCNEFDMDFAYNDKNSPYYKKIAFDENENSIGVFLKVNNHSVFLAGDLSNTDYGYPCISKRAERGIKDIYNKYSINKIEIYKAAHHGHQYNNPLDLLKLINPDYVVITNTDKWLNNWETIPNIKKVNKNATIFATDYYIHVIDLSNEKAEIESIPATSTFILENRD